MRSLGGLSLLGSTLAFIAGCGGGGTSEGAKFCGDWATAFCQKLYDCTPVDMRGDNFLGGSSQSQCNSIWSHACSDKPPAGVTFDINCSGGAHVNKVARDMCFDELSTITCDDFNAPTYSSICTQVCGSSGGGGAGGFGGAGGAGGAGLPPTDGRSFCTTFEQKTCQLAFDCIPAPHSAGFTAQFGNTLGECQGAKTTADCANISCVPSYDALAGNDCFVAYSAFTCDDFMSTPLPASCTTACQTSTTGTGGSGGASGAGGTGGSGGAGGGTLGPNLVVNGDFASGEANWSVTLQTGTQLAHDVTNGMLCAVIDASETVTIRWPIDVTAAFAIHNGSRYQFSYSASGIVNVASFEAKVGQAVAPYTATDFRTNETLGQSQQYAHTFTATADDLKAGVAFTAASSSAGTAIVCVGNVAVRALQ